MKARACLVEAFKEPLRIKEITIPELEPGQVLVKIKAAGVCGSDLHIWRGEDPRIKLPLILGHEGVGEVAAVKGKKLTVEGKEVKEGDSILWNRGLSCGHCYYCAVLKEPSFCPHRIVQGINITCNEPPYLNGCYADFLILPAGIDVFHLPSGIDPAVLVAASCSGATAAHGFDLARPEPGEAVAVVGPGPLGLFAVAFARAYGASQVILSGGSQVRLEMGRTFGATATLNRHEQQPGERIAAVMDLTRGRGADLAVEAVGSAAALEEAIALVRPGGTVLSVGFGQPGGSFAFDGYQHLARRNIRLQGVWVSDTRHVYRAMAMILAHPQLFSRMITHRFPLEQVNEALEVMARKEAIKAVLIP
ncbi:zinc-binding dehydrogenase [Moorella naiadis]|uniref:zinc-binding dehydrogenase n=1 Tax=Moorella naiadis (nom. illeg.) TaxID=3093670 RepID=UPI003D9CAB9A